MAGKRKKAQEKKEESVKPDKGKEEMSQAVKDIESAMFSVKFYPVAVDEQKKDDAVKKLKQIYKKGDANTKQLLLYMIHEAMSMSGELKFMKNFEHFRARAPNRDPVQIRMNVYRSMYNYNTALEGIVEFIRMLGDFGGDDAAKVLGYHYSHLCTMENEASHVLRNAIIDALGDSSSTYALKLLLDYARYTDNERVQSRVIGALSKWNERMESVKINAKQKERLMEELKDRLSKEPRGSHYG